MEEPPAEAPPPPRQPPEFPESPEKVVAGAPELARPPPAAAAPQRPEEPIKREVEEVPPTPPRPPPLSSSGVGEKRGASTEGEAVAGATAAASAAEEEELTLQSPQPQLPEEPPKKEGGERPTSPLPSQPPEGEDCPPPPGLSEEEAEALRLKSLAEEKYRSGGALKAALKHAKRALRLAPDLDGLPQMVTALRVLRAPPDDHYRTLLLEPFSHVNTVRGQYKALALALHPDKNAASLSAFPGSEDAFKRVGESFQVLSDRARRREYDVRLRVELEAAARARAEESAAAVPLETFWTACTACRLFHQFDRRYVGQRLICPRCKKSFLAVEVRIDGGDEGGGGNEGEGGASAAANTRVRANRSTRSAIASGSPAISRFPRSPRSARSSRATSTVRVPTYQEGAMRRKRRLSFEGSSEEPSPKRAKEKTLAELQLEVKKNSRSKPSLSRGKEKGRENSRALVPCGKHGRDLSTMAVEDSDFYDFDKHRTEKSVKRGQIWAVYDDDDGMPRHYGLIVEVFSTNPFRVKMSWLDVQSNGDEALLLWEKQGVHISSGRFKVGRKVDIDSVNFFSHVVDSEQAAKELYRIYPKKGSVWALYSEGIPNGCERRRYDIVLLLTSYSEMYGLSMAYLVKVEGFKTIFKRREIGVHAIRWLGKDDTRMFSHQIPVRKLSGTEGPDLPGECWELDPASLPPDLLRIDWKG